MLATLQFVYLTLSVGIGVMAVGDGNFHLYSAAYYATMNKCTVYIYIYICVTLDMMLIIFVFLYDI